MQGGLQCLQYFSSGFKINMDHWASSCIRICIADIKVQMQMRMQGEWPCPNSTFILNEKYAGGMIWLILLMGPCILIMYVVR